MKKLKWFKVGDDIPDNANYIKSKTVRENYKESNWTWCGCSDHCHCTCAKWENVEHHLYETTE